MSFIARKPKPLGTEFKNLVDGVTGALLWLEIQEGKERMRRKEYQELGSTAACVLRGVTSSESYVELLQNNNTVDEAIPVTKNYILAIVGLDRLMRLLL